MGKKPLIRRNRKNFLGKFAVGTGAPVFGELKVSGKKTLLTLHADAPLQGFEDATAVHGIAFTGEHLSLLNCTGMGSGESYAEHGAVQYRVHVFPHHVVTGHAPLEPDDCCIEDLQFTTSDLHALFHDFDAYGTIPDAARFMEILLEDRPRHRQVQVGDYPLLAYYTGKREIVSVPTALGSITVEHQPSYTTGDTRGVHVKNRLVVRIHPDQPMDFSDAMRRMSDVMLFLSICAGRVQDARHIALRTTESIGDIPVVLTVRPSFSWRKHRSRDLHAPHCGDVPLNPIDNSDEFRRVLGHWAQSHSERRVARFRHLAGLRKGSQYGPERIVAAANVFDILPPSVVPDASDPSPELACAVAQCRDILRALAPSRDRDGALSALGRLGKPSLPKKVASRARIVAGNMPGLPHLEWLGMIAVKCRNFFVHGASEDFDYDKVDGFLPFLTDALEFIFGASDLIDAGWDPRGWSSEMHGVGHSLARFRHEYHTTIGPLRAALQLPADP